MKVISVEVINSVSRNTGKAFTRYDAVLEGGIKASGFDPVVIGEEVSVKQEGKYLNFIKEGATAPSKPKFMGSEPLFNREDYWTRKEKRDLDQQPRIERQHSQQMALMYYQITGKMPESWGEFKDKVSQFQCDIGTSPFTIPIPQPGEPELPTELPTDPQDELSY